MDRLDFRKLPFGVLIAAGGLFALGCLGILRGDELVGGPARLPKQLLFGGMAVISGAIAASVRYRRSKTWIAPAFGVTLIALVAVYACPTRGGAHRWIPLGVIDFQPSEVAKLTFIATLALWLSDSASVRTIRGLITPFVLTAIPVVLIVREPDLGTSLLFFPVLAMMLLAAGARGKHLILAIAMGATMLPALWTVMSAEQKSRVTTLFTQQDGGTTPRGDGYHLHQSKQLLALGGVWGSAISGEPVDDPLAYHLPAGRTDFVFCLIGERYGIPGAAATLFLSAMLAVSVFRVGYRTRDPFGRLICVGIATLLASQATINTAMTVGLMPITGLTLPLCSYGGSSLVSTGVALGLVTSISLRPGFDVADTTFRWQNRAAA